MDLEQPLARMAERVERPALDERLDGALVEGLDADPLHEVHERREGAVGVAFLEHFRNEPLPHIADGGEPEDDPPRRRGIRTQTGLRGEVRFRAIDVGDSDLDAHEPTFVEVHRG